MDVNQRKKIRELKARERKKATASDGLGRESLEESLLANAELGVSLGSGRLLSGDETSALPSPQPTSRRVNFSGDPFAAGTSSEPVPSPFEAQAVPSQRSGKDLWGVARRNRSHIAEMGEGANGRAIDREQSAPNIVGSLMFKLQNQRLKKALEGVAAEQREPSLTPASTAQDAEEESPGRAHQKTFFPP